MVLFQRAKGIFVISWSESPEVMAAAGDLRSLLGAAQFNTLSRDMQVSYQNNFFYF
jgi:hypothetical protein